MTATTDRVDIYTAVTDSIIAALEAGTAPWAPGWASAAAALPRRSTGEAYRGVNVLMLWGAAAARGYTQSRWMTFKQAIDLGAAVRKGAKASRVVKAGRLTRDAGEGQTGDDNGQVHIPFLKAYSVFNVEQIDGLGAEWFDAPHVCGPEPERDATAEAFFNALPIAVDHGGGRAYYSRKTDRVALPPLADFDDAHGYYSVRAHESVHWTGAPSRLDRTHGKRFGDSAYAFEELVAEIGAAFTCATLGLSAEPREDHAAYIEGWLKVLRNDKRAIFTAASQAQAATDYLHTLAQPVAVAA